MRSPELDHACALCGSSADPLRDPVRLIEGRLAPICRTCAADDQTGNQDEQAVLEVTGGRGEAHVRCGCGALVPVTAAGVTVKADGEVAAMCQACAEVARQVAEAKGNAQLGSTAGSQDAAGGLRGPASSAAPIAPAAHLAIDVVTAADAAAFAPASWQRPPVWWRHMMVAIIIAGIAALANKASSNEPKPVAAMHGVALANMQHLLPDGTAVTSTDVGADRNSDPHGHENEPAVEEGEGNLDSEGLELPPTMEDLLENSEEPLEERLPTLAEWVFPVAASTEEFPLKASRRFGATRTGVDRPECGRGHCGVDLDGPRGTPILAVAWGQVVRVEQSTDGRSGKYVQIQHPDYVYTSYMHLDEIAPELRVGDEVEAGQYLGTLGSTGVLHSAPHLHFGLEIPGDGRLLAIDPEPYLQRATRLPVSIQ